MRPRVKICGVTTPEDALLASGMGADFLGLNFHPPSPRALSSEQARTIVDALRADPRARARTRLVGVFVDVPVVAVAEIDRAVGGLDLLQFHGDESPDVVAPFAPRAIVVQRVRDQVDVEALRPFAALGVWGYLFDTHDPAFGGSGRGWRFETLHRFQAESRPRIRTLVAGGIGPHNVRRVIEAASPWAVDICSGVEQADDKRRKDPQLLRRLFHEVDHPTGQETHHGQSALAS